MNDDIVKLIKNLSRDFNQKLSFLHFEFINQTNELILSVESKLKQSSSANKSDDFLTLKFSELLHRIKASRHNCSKILVAPASVFTSPDSTEVVFVCSDGSLMVANGVRASAYSSSFGPQAPHLNFASSSSDTSSSTVPEILGLNHALQTAIIWNIRNLVIFTDSTQAGTIACTAILSSTHQSHELLSLAKKIPLLKPIFENLYNNGKKMDILAICHQNAHQTITDAVSATNSIADALAQEEAKNCLLSKLPQMATRPRMTEVNFSIPSTAQGLSY